MKPLTPFKQGFLGGLASLLLVALLIAAGAVLAQEPYDPNKDIDVNGIIDVVDIQEVAASWNTSGSPRGTLVVFGTTTSTPATPPPAMGGGACTRPAGWRTLTPTSARPRRSNTP